jgi:hypothetical protein
MNTMTTVAPTPTTTTELATPAVHVIRWSNPSTGIAYVLVGLRTGQVGGDYEDLTHVIKFDALTATVVARFDRLDEVARSGDVPGYRIPGDADWWQDRWLLCQRERTVAAVESHLALLHVIDDLS